ncbi:peroxisomal membrane protein 2 [Cloeon dipterum]|uniref:peroxisomal membrane protein 2 n=1 Tax=Cloeon dipterum TaxID=197152 RepID=UPI00321FA6F0
MSLSKASKVAPFLFEIVGGYIQELVLNPVRTQAATNSLVLFLGNATSQRCYNAGKPFDKDSAMASTLFGLVFGGAVPHHFYRALDSLSKGKQLHGKFFRFLVERLVFAPLYLLLRLYMTTIFEGKSHRAACKQVFLSYQKLLKDNWVALSIFQFYGVNFVPPIFRPIFSGVIEFFWTIHLSNVRRAVEEKKRR